MVRSIKRIAKHLSKPVAFLNGIPTKILKIPRYVVPFYHYGYLHELRTPNEGINQRNLKIWADLADKICFGRT